MLKAKAEFEELAADVRHGELLPVLKEIAENTGKEPAAVEPVNLDPLIAEIAKLQNSSRDAEVLKALDLIARKMAALAEKPAPKITMPAAPDLRPGFESIVQKIEQLVEKVKVLEKRREPKSFHLVRNEKRELTDIEVVY